MRAHFSCADVQVTLAKVAIDWLRELRDQALLADTFFAPCVAAFVC